MNSHSFSNEEKIMLDRLITGHQANHDALFE
jgi:hypothetical protein